MNQKLKAWFFDNGAIKLLSAIGIYASTQMSAMSTSVQQLNTNVAVLVEKMARQESQQASTLTAIGVLDGRLDRAESDLAVLFSAWPQLKNSRVSR